MRPLLVFLLLTAPADAATLRTLVTLDTPVIRVADLFDDAGPAGERVLGAAPAPGSRILVEAPQLAAIARQFGVDWRPGSPSDRITLDRPGRPLPRETVLTALRVALAELGAGSDLELDIGGFSPPMITPGAKVSTTIEQLDWDAGTGRFTGQLTISGEGMAMQRLRLAGSAQEMIALPVPTRRLNPGTVLQPDDIRIARVRAGLAQGEVIRTPEQAFGQTLVRQVTAGHPLAVSDLTRTPVITKGTRVLMRLRGDGMVMTAGGQALEAGVAGDHIRVLNVATRAVVDAEIIGPGEVRVLPGTQPLVAASGQNTPPITQLARNTP